MIVEPQRNASVYFLRGRFVTLKKATLLLLLSVLSFKPRLERALSVLGG